MKLRLTIIFAIVFLAFIGKGRAQAQQAASDTIRLGGIVTAQGDTLPMVFLPDFVKAGKWPKHLVRQRIQNDRLRYNVYKVYPYAVIAADLLRGVDDKLAQMNTKGERKAYLKGIEKELNKRFKGELENLTITQGQILVKLIDRQTGKNCYSIIRELKGGFSAVIWQSVGLLFSNNLKREYDPEDRDREIEAVVQEIEGRGGYRSTYQLQGSR